MFWLLFRYSVFAFFVLMAFWYTAKHKHLELLCLYFWAIGFANCFVYLGTIWNPAKMVSLFMIWCILTHEKQRPPEHKGLYNSFFSLYVVVVLMSNIVAMLTERNLLLVEDSSPIARVLLQDFSYLTMGVLLFYGNLLDYRFAPKVYKSYCTAVEVSIVIGLVHLVFNALGLTFMPIMRISQSALFDAADSVKAHFGEQTMLRVYAFAGEPKGLGFYLVPYLLMSITGIVSGKTRGSMARQIIFLLLGLFVLLNTFSSSAIIAFFLSLPFVLFYATGKFARRAMIGLVAIMAISAPFIIKHAALPSKDEGTGFAQALFDRTFKRGVDELSSGRQEVNIMETYMEGNFSQLLFGWGMGQYSFHVEKSFTENGDLRTVQSGIVHAVADFGLMGLVLYVILGFALIKALVRSSKGERTLPKLFAMAAFTSYMGSLMYGSLFTCFVFWMMYHYSELPWNEKS
ncbi:MAG: hypothetical protein J5771_07140 [Bacteroidales bacterium]|nr:hypothetical protein [Bacteroidales bacterium]